MSDQVSKNQHDEQGDEVEGHGFKSANDEAQDELENDVEAHVSKSMPSKSSPSKS